MDRRSQLKLEYKNKPRHMGIYQIRNQVSGKVYVGSSLNLDGTLNRYQMEIKYGWRWNDNRGLTKDMEAYGPENFAFEILDQLKPNDDPLYDYREDLRTLEALWLEKLQPYEERGYNKRKPDPD